MAVENSSRRDWFIAKRKRSVRSISIRTSRWYHISVQIYFTQTTSTKVLQNNFRGSFKICTINIATYKQNTDILNQCSVYAEFTVMEFQNNTIQHFWVTVSTIDLGTPTWCHYWLKYNKFWYRTQNPPLPSKNTRSRTAF